MLSQTITHVIRAFKGLLNCDTDALYGKSNTTMSDWSKSNGLVTARYPAGMASYWNWEDPSGTMGQSTLVIKLIGT